MLQDDTFAYLFPTSTSQSPSSIMYSPPLHLLSQPHALSQPDMMTYAASPEYLPMLGLPEPEHDFQYWPSEPSSLPEIHPTYSTYPPLTEMNLTNNMHGFAPDSTFYSPDRLYPTRLSRSHSASSQMGLGVPSMNHSRPRYARSVSPSAPDLRAYGFPNNNGTWSCAYPGCTSRAVFTRGCDLRKHHKRHTKSFFCRHEGCPQSIGGGFSSKKDLARHEARHNPGVACDWDGCDRVFSRVDNMV